MRWSFIMAVQPSNVVSNNLTRVSGIKQESFNLKRNEYQSHLEGRVINELNDRVLINNPSNSLYTFTMENFQKGYSQAKRGSVSHTDCSYFTSSALQQMIREMRPLRNNNGGSVFNEGDLNRTSKIFATGSTTSGQEAGLRSLYRDKGITPNSYTGSQVANAFQNENEVGKVIILDKDKNPRTIGDRHIWVSVRDPNTNRIAWAESTSGVGVIISTPDEILKRHPILKNTTQNRGYTLFDPFVGQNRQALNEYDKQSMALTVAYHANKRDMQENMKVSGVGHTTVDTNTFQQFMDMQNRLMKDKHDIINNNINELKQPEHQQHIRQLSL